VWKEVTSEELLSTLRGKIFIDTTIPVYLAFEIPGAGYSLRFYEQDKAPDATAGLRAVKMSIPVYSDLVNIGHLEYEGRVRK
ncbi:MAG: hypothetical protein NT001_06950, partial [Candidatus Woesearchaeota archaeon]|nr:hypothetical protein [Candidatus Woesearchaeota archaeon]